MRSKALGFRNPAWLLCGVLCLSGVESLTGAPLLADTLPVTTLPGEPSTAGTRISQRQADRAFERGDFERAHRIFLRKLAPKGDKHAHYMLGHHYREGLGVPADRARALAWYALAAERGAVGARATAAQLSETLSERERERADVIFAELQERYGDRQLLVKAIRRDMRELRRRTGSRVGGGTSPTRVITEFGTITGDQYYDALEARIQLRTQILGGNVTLGELELIDTPEEEPSESPQSEEP